MRHFWAKARTVEQLRDAQLRIPPGIPPKDWRPLEKELGLVWISALPGDPRSLLGLWHMGVKREVAKFDLDDDALAQALVARAGRSKLMCLARHGPRDALRTSALWHPTAGPGPVFHRQRPAAFAAAVATLRTEGFGPRFLLDDDLSGSRRLTSSWVRLYREERPRLASGGPGGAHLDEAALEALVASGATRAALAVLDGRRLVAARGYAYPGVGGEPTPPDARFRLGGLRPLLWAAVARRLAELGRLELDAARATRLGGLLAGFESAEPAARELLDEARVARGEAFQRLVFEPLGARSAAPAQPGIEGRLPGEVYREAARHVVVAGAGVLPEPYAVEVPGDWVVSAPDLARVLTALRPPGGVPLVPPSLGARSLGAAGHVEWLPGGLALVLLLNADVDPAPLAAAIRGALAASPPWPAGDLFETY